MFLHSSQCLLWSLICYVYYRPWHFWKIPLYSHEWRRVKRKSDTTFKYLCTVDCMDCTSGPLVLDGKWELSKAGPGPENFRTVIYGIQGQLTRSQEHRLWSHSTTVETTTYHVTAMWPTGIYSISVYIWILTQTRQLIITFMSSSSWKHYTG